MLHWFPSISVPQIEKCSKGTPKSEETISQWPCLPYYRSAIQSNSHCQRVHFPWPITQALNLLPLLSLIRRLPKQIIQSIGTWSGNQLSKGSIAFSVKICSLLLILKSTFYLQCLPWHRLHHRSGHHWNLSISPHSNSNTSSLYKAVLHKWFLAVVFYI